MGRPFVIERRLLTSHANRISESDTFIRKGSHLGMLGVAIPIRKPVLRVASQADESRPDAWRFDTSCAYFVVGTFTDWKIPSLPMAVDASSDDGLRLVHRIVVRGRDEFQILKNGDWDK